MGSCHILHAIGDNLARGQRVEHAVVTHCDTVVDGDGVELGCKASEAFDFGLDLLAYFVQVYVTRHELSK